MPKNDSSSSGDAVAVAGGNNYAATTTTTVASSSSKDDHPQQHPLLVRKLSRTLSSMSAKTASPSLSSSPFSRGGPQHHATQEQQQQQHSLVGIVLIVMGSFTFSCMFLFVKLLGGKANTFTVSFYRALVEIPVALWLCGKSGDGSTTTIDDYIGPPGRARSWLLVRGSTGGAAVLCFFYAIQHLSLPDAVTLQFTTPPFAAAFAVWFANERWRCLDMVGAVVCLMGVVLIAHPTWLFGKTTSTEGDSHGAAAGEEGASDSLGAIAVALLGAAFAGMAYMSVRMIGHDTTANVMVLYYSCLSLLLTLVGSKFFLGTWNVWAGGANLGGLDWCWMLLTGLTAYTGQYLTNLGLQYESAATGTLATCSQIVFTYLFEMMFLHESINAWSVAGTLLIIGFMVIVAIFKMKEEAKDQTPHDEEMVAGEPEELALLFTAAHRVRSASE